MPEIINIDELTQDDLMDYQNKLNGKKLILKFSATWCKPCVKLNKIWDEKIKDLPDDVQIIPVDIDESLELYVKLKSLKMISGVPTIMLWYKKEDKWYIPNVVISGTKEEDIDYLLKMCYK